MGSSELQARLGTVEIWTVPTTLEGDAPVRQEADPDSEKLGVKAPGTQVSGVQEGKWVRLTGEQGYMLIRKMNDTGDGPKTLLERSKTSSEKPKGGTTGGAAIKSDYIPAEGVPAKKRVGAERGCCTVL